MLFSVLSIIANAAFMAVLNVNLYTDRARMATGEVREWHRSPVNRLYIMDRPVLLYLQILFAAVSVITNILVLCGVKSSTVKTVQVVSTAASAVMFVVILIVTANSHAKYA